MPQYIDSYYLIDDRNSNIKNDFFIDFSFTGNELSEDYPIPQFSDVAEKVFFDVDKLLLFLDNKFDEDYIIYWENLNKESIIRQFTLIYTDDAKMIIGISISGSDPNSNESIDLFKKIKNYLNSQIGCITLEELAPSNSVEFIEFCRMRFTP